MKHIYFIRHAPTIVNKTGEMVNDYKNVHITPLTKSEIYNWFDKVGKHIEIFKHVYISNTTRTYETAQILAPSVNAIVNDALNEIDCSGLRNKKFWKISEDKFNKLVSVNLEQFDLKVKMFISEILNLESDNIVCITHGLYIRHLYHLLTNNKADTLYKQINSIDFRFNPLDMMEIIYSENIETNKKSCKSLKNSQINIFNDDYKIKQINIYRYK